ncbi:hypothetical protein BOVAC1_5430 [Bacteroides ovatus]|nr:hypothetical protein BOVAC1_5430 [Bacteroides ovatus]
MFALCSRFVFTLFLFLFGYIALKQYFYSKIHFLYNFKI